MTTSPTATTSSFASQWESEGYMFVPNLIDAARIKPLLEMSEYILKYNSEKGHPAKVMGNNVVSGQKRVPQDWETRNLNHPDFFLEHPEWFPILMDLIADEAILELLTPILKSRPLFRTTTLLFNPLAEHPARDGNWHRDTQFTTKTDEEEKHLLFNDMDTTSVQFMIALVPSSDSQVVPGSQLRWDTPEEYRIRKSENGIHNTSNDMPGAVRVSLQPGDSVSFDSRGLHRGRYHHEVPRRTLLLTYRASRSPGPSDVFNRQPWFLEPDYLKPLSPRTKAFFEPFIEAYSESWR